MSGDLKELHEKARRVVEDLTLATLSLDAAFELGMDGPYLNIIQDTYLHHTSRLASDALVAYSASALLRAIDKPTYATVPAVIQMVSGHTMRSQLIDGIMGWPTTAAEAEDRGTSLHIEAERAFRTIVGSLNLDLLLIEQHGKTLRILRNRHLSHSAIGMKGDNPQYSDIAFCVRIGDCMGYSVSSLAFGAVHDVEEQRDNYAGFARRFTKAVALGIAAGADDDDWNGWGVLPRVSGD